MADFYFGDYKGKSVSQVALTTGNIQKGGGYPYLEWVLQNLTRIDHNLRTDIERHIQVLNNFSPVYPCDACKQPNPELISGIYDFDGKAFFNSPGYVYHNACKGKIMADKYFLVPIGFSAIQRAATFPHSIREGAHKVMRSLAGWDEAKKITRKNAEEFIAHLEEQSKERRTPLLPKLEQLLVPKNYEPGCLG